MLGYVVSLLDLNISFARTLPARCETLLTWLQQWFTLYILHGPQPRLDSTEAIGSLKMSHLRFNMKAYNVLNDRAMSWCGLRWHLSPALAHVI